MNIDKRSIIILIIVLVLLVVDMLVVDVETTNAIANTFYYDQGYYAKWIEKIIVVLNTNNIDQIQEEKKAQYIVPTVFNKNPKTLYRQLGMHNNKIFLSIPNPDCIAKKDLLWKNIKEYWGLKVASDVMPMSYAFPDDYDLYTNNYSFNRKIIFKQNKQQQKGLYITKKKLKISDISTQKFIVGQHYLDDPYLYNRHKINIRLYLAIVCGHDNVEAFVFNDGIISYTEKVFDKKDNSDEAHIASFYKSKSLYNLGYPITVNRFLNKENINHSHFFSKMLKQSKFIVSAVTHKILNSFPYPCGPDNKCAELFGIDFYIDSKLSPKVLEINVGPGMSSFNNKDKQMRNKLLNDFLRLPKLLNLKDTNTTNRASNFYQIQ